MLKSLEAGRIAVVIVPAFRGGPSGTSPFLISRRTGAGSSLIACGLNLNLHGQQGIMPFTFGHAADGRVTLGSGLNGQIGHASQGSLGRLGSLRSKRLMASNKVFINLGQRG